MFLVCQRSRLVKSKHFVSCYSKQKAHKLCRDAKDNFLPLVVIKSRGSRDGRLAMSFHTVIKVSIRLFESRHTNRSSWPGFCMMQLSTPLAPFDYGNIYLLYIESICGEKNPVFIVFLFAGYVIASDSRYIRLA